MIYKQKRPNTDDKYDIVVADQNGKKFTMTVAGNLDLFWCPDDMREDIASFIIDNNDKIFYPYLMRLFQLIKDRDNNFCPTMQDNVFTFVSEDTEEEHANKLQIIQNEDNFIINFYKNLNKSPSLMPKMSNYICFCNSGSRVPKVEQLFMLMFNHMAYQNTSITLQDDKEIASD